MTAKITLLCISLLGSLSLGGPKLVLSGNLQNNHQVFSVKGRQGILIRQKLSFGEYRTTSVRRSGLHKFSGLSGYGNLFWVEHVRGKQALRFQLANEAGETSQVYCMTRLREQDFSVGSRPNSIVNILGDLAIRWDRFESNFSAAIFPGGESEQPWELFLDNIAAQTNTDKAVGFLRRGAEAYQIVPIRHMWKGDKALKALGTLGLEIRTAEGKAVAAVSLIDHGEVYLPRDPLPEQFLLANACAALLLQEYVD